MKLQLQPYRIVIVGFLLLLVGLILPNKISLVLVTGILTILSFFQPKQGLLLLLVYVPIRPFLIEINPGLKLVGDAITFVLLLRIFYDARKDWKSLFRFKTFEWAFFAFLAFGTAIGFATGVSIAALVFQIRTFVIMYLLYYIVSRMKIDKADMLHFSWVTIGLSVLISIHGIIEKLSLRQLLLPDAWSEKMLSATNFVRIYGLPGNPNSLALFLGFTIVLVLFLLEMAKGKERKWLYACLTLFIGVLLLTYSRGTWISIITGGVLFFILSKYWKLLKPLLITAVLGFVLIYLPVNAGVGLVQSLGVDGGGHGAGGLTDRFKETFDEENLELMAQSGRFFYIKKGFEVFKDHPITGTGFGTFGGSATLSYGSPIYDEYGIRSDIYGGKYFYSDNQYIQVIAETGAIGVILFAAFLLLMVWMFWKQRHEGNFPKFMIALWFATGVSGMYYNIWELKVYTLYFFLIFGAYASLKGFYRKN
ncbi:O-antigen ligase family protein [Cytobacillus massiliigabonensis]|uniref:O-antigen ligase family protein n=1 Tax=Cytobacillus massiliigabonensis TaxID=1871011 RepID=UPI000C83A793|nr:O-antigen ligase family protein [Cytobacillus massiliigabonensis]